MPDTTYMMLSHMSEFRRIFTDGRKWPEDIEAAYAGYSIGKWEDTDRDGRFDTLVVETRAIRAPRTFDDSGIPLHKDNHTVVKERIRSTRPIRTSCSTRSRSPTTRSPGPGR